jgi:hypothetical protein
VSYQEFIDDVNIILGEDPIPMGSSHDQVNTHLDKVFRRVFDVWLADERYDGLIAWVVQEFDALGGEEFFLRLSDHLLERRDEPRLARLWKGVIATRRALAGKPVPEDKPGISAYDREVILSVIWAMSQFCSALEQLGSNERLARVQEDLRDFKAGKRRRTALTSDRRKMNERLFWSLIEESRGCGCSCGEIVEALTERLEAFGLREIRSFQKLLHQFLAMTYTWNHWALAYIAQRGCSDDGFDYFRAWLVTRGEEAYRRAANDLEFAASLIGEENPQCEGLLYAAEDAYENKKGEPMGLLRLPKVELKGEEWSENQLSQRFPNLCGRFGFP